MVQKILYGRKKSLTLPGGEKHTAQYVIVDLDEIKASHNEVSFNDTEGYPVNDLGRNINDRNYKNDPAAQQTVMSIAQNLDADKLIELTSSPSGTPIINKDGFVVSGNNRIMSLKLAASKYPEQYSNYIKTLGLEAGSFGFDPHIGAALILKDPIALPGSSFHNPLTVKFNKPVLVRIDEDIPSLNTTELSKYNLNAKKGERPVDKAIKLANILRENERCRSVILAIIDGYETFSDLYSANGKNDRKKLVQAFIDCGLIPEQQMMSYYTEGEFTEAGKDFLESILSAMILSPDALTVAGLEGVKRMRQTIISCLPVLITNQHLPEGSLQPYISEAVIIEHKIRQVGDFKDFIQSQDLFGENNFNEKSYYINRLLAEGRSAFKSAIIKYTEAIKSNSGNSMFASEQLSPKDVFEKTIERKIPESDQELIYKKFAKPKKMTEIATIETLDVSPAPAAKKNLWVNDNFFAENPDKVLGTAYQTSGRFGEVTKYKGDLGDLNKIEVPDNFIGNMKAVNDPLASVVDQRNPELDSLQAPMQEKIESIIAKSEEEAGKKMVARDRKKKKSEITDETIAVKETADLQTFEEIYKKYNDQISADELEAFVWWKSHTGKPLSRRWINLIKPGTYSQDSLFIPTAESYDVPKEKIEFWIKNGLVYYVNGKYEPAVIYLSGNVYDKKAQLQRDKDDIIELYGNDVYQAQSTSFAKAFAEKYKTRLTITGNTEDGLVLIPISKFAEKFQVTGLQMMAEDAKFKIKTRTLKGKKILDFENDANASEYKKDEFETLSLKHAFENWLLKGNPAFKEAVNSVDIVKYYLDGKSIRNPYEHGTIEYEAEKAKIEKLKSTCQREGQRLFLFFLNDQLLPDDKIKLETEWNTAYNNYLPVDYNKIPVAFTMCKYYKGKEEIIRPEKREAVASAMVEGSLCLSYDVGVGKTPSAIFTISAFLDAGFCLRPFICVPNQVYKQFISEIKAFAPHIPVLEAYNLGDEYIKNFQDTTGAIIKVPAGTITVMTYEGLEQIGFTDNTYGVLFAELYEILNQGGEEERAKTEKQKEEFAQKLETLLGKGLRGTLYNIEDFGFDFGCYDEAHKMKKVFTAVKGEVEEDDDGKKSRGRNPYAINSGSPSAIGLKGFMLNYYIQKNNNWQNVLLLTATPFTNSPLEIFSVLSMIAYNKLRETDLNNIKSFFDTYISTSTELVINSRLQPQFKQVITGFNNLLSLQTLIRRFINYKTGEQVNVQRPKKYVLPYLRKIEGETVINLNADERIETYIQMTAAQSAMMADVISYVEGKLSLRELSLAQAASNLDEMDEEDGSDKSAGVEVDFESLNEDEKLGVKIIRGITFSQNLALSPYLYPFSGMRSPSYKDYIESSPKLKYVVECIRTVKQWHDKNKTPISGQIIYMNRGVEYFELIRQYLIKEVGYAPHEVGIIKSGLPKNGVKSKEYIKNLFNGEIYNESTKLFDQISDKERIKVVIGSSTIKEGINLQRYSTVLYNCFMDWNPTDIQQVDGRLWRQGNTFASVRIVNPLVTDSADIFLFQKLQEKTTRLNSIWSTDGRKNVLNTEEFDPSELKYELIRDPKVVAELKSVDEANSVTGDILGQKRLIETANTVKENISTIQLKYDDVKELVDEYRDFKPGKDKFENAEKLVKLIIDIDKKQTNKKGQKMVDRWKAEELRKKREWDPEKYIEVSGYGSRFNKPYWFSDFSIAVRDLKKQYDSFLNPFKIRVSIDNSKDLDSFKEQAEKKIKELEAFQEKIKGEDYKKELTKKIVEEREEKKIVYKSLMQAVKDFTKLNHLLGDKKVSQAPVVQLSSACPPMAGHERLTDQDSLKQLEECVLKQTETKSLHTDTDGNYNLNRKKVHDRIIADIFANVKCIKAGEPLAIFTGGAPGSGKSTYLKTIDWLMDKEGNINPNIFHIDADAIRAMLPEYTGWNASVTHKETQDIVRDVLDKLGEGSCRFDFVYDGTMNTANKYFPLINKVKGMGYRTFIIFMEVPYSVSKERTIARYKKKGRYVPQEVIDDFFTMLPAPINKTKGQYALDQLKEVVDGYVVVNGVTGEIIDQKGVDLPKQRYYRKTKVELVPKAEEKLKAVRIQKPKPVAAPVKTPVIEKPAIVEPVIASPEMIEKQIKALTLAVKYANADEKPRIKKQISALTVALKYAA